MEEERAREEALIAKHGGLVRMLARRLCGGKGNEEDLLQVGYIGLLKALRGFDETRGFAFSTYAVPVILGEMRGYLREGGAIKVSRSLRALGAKLHRAAEELGEEASVAACAERAGITQEEAALASGVFLPARSFSEEALCELPAEGEETERLLDRMALKAALCTLPAREKRIVLLRYFQGLSQEKTGNLLGMTQVQVSRAQKRALLLLRQELECAETGDAFSEKEKRSVSGI